MEQQAISRIEVINKYFTEEEKKSLLSSLLKELRSIRIYWKGNLVMCDIGDYKNGYGVSFFVPDGYLRALFYKKKFYMYMTRWYGNEEIAKWKEQQKLNSHKLAKANLDGEKSDGR